MQKLLVALIAVSALLVVTGLSSLFAAQPARIEKTNIGEVLADPEGLTLYTFANDAPGVSNCTGPCADRWSPHYAGDADKPVGEYTVITRDDGSLQWAYKGMPLYQWVEDEEPGETKGDGMNGIWHAARP